MDITLIKELPMLKQKRPRNCLIFTVGIVTLVSSLSIFLLFLAYKNYTERSQRNRTYQEIGEEIRSRVGIGDEREKALQAMVAAGAWSSIKCEEIDNDVIYDYFYFGPKDKDKAFVFMKHQFTKMANINLIIYITIVIQSPIFQKHVYPLN
jgi:hypothetical protein